MPFACFVNGCSNRSDQGITSFHSFPTEITSRGEVTKSLSAKRRKKWIAAINRKDVPSKYAKVCGQHFISGAPSGLYEETNPDWIPTLLLNRDVRSSTNLRDQETNASIKNTERYARAIKRKIQADVNESISAPAPSEQLEQGSSTMIPENELQIQSDEHPDPCEKPTCVSTAKKYKMSVEQMQELITENIRLKKMIMMTKIVPEAFEGMSY